ncbi:MAG: hypothetical protein LBJ24_00830 [Treponema sp.]|jgi:hypothetical protein|nr:hypothetical protein [Treponema sp.]
MIKKFLRLFKEYRELKKELEGEAALMGSMRRYIDALEGRDKERLIRIEELEAKNRDALAVLREALEAAADLRTRLDGLCPHHKEEES